MITPHVVVVPSPAQGHVIPMLELSQWLVSHGVKVTFVNTHFTHRRVVESSSSSPAIGEVVNMVSVWDGLEEWEDRSDLAKLSEAMLKVMSAELEALITKLNRNEGPKITCVIADWIIAFVAGDAAERNGLRTAVFCPPSAVTLATTVSIPKLVTDGVIDDEGQLLWKKHTYQLSPTMAPINSADISWTCMGNQIVGKQIFHLLSKSVTAITSADWIVCNSSYDLEAAAFSSFPHFKPIGPLLAANRLAKSAGSFWAEDSGCLSWLDRHPPNSVIYAAFGSHAVLATTQFHELALGLELTGMPFLWVVRQDMTVGAYPEGFMERVEGRGRVVGWAPQQQVLCHPSVACFISHCGWNSTMEGVGNGVPFLCWPYFADQFMNRNYICDEWKVGLGLEKDENGIITSREVKEKVEMLVGDGGYKERILNLRARVMESVRVGRSHKNFSNFVEWIKNVCV